MKSVCSEIVSIDGKTLRGSWDDNYNVIHMVSAWAGKAGIVLGQQRVNEKSNEITAVPELLDLTDVENCIIMSDAMSCQKNTVKKICEKNCDYVICLKGNQEMLHGMYSCILKLHLLRHNYIFLSKPSL